MQTLRKSVGVKFSEDHTTLSHGFWSIDFPSAWVQSTSGIERLLRKEGSACEIDQKNEEAAGVLELLSKTYCLTFSTEESYSLREVLGIFRAVCSTWHGIYYSHPLWAKLKKGQLSRNALIAWALHNYHLSRSAGVTAARCVVAKHSTKIRSVFLESAIEEYPHCEFYYSLDDNRLGITRDDSIHCIPSKATLLFEQQLLRIAELDWLGHLFVGYFQESTAVFYEDCCDFYKEVEEKYGLTGFFAGWKSHIRLDHDYGHADAFSDAFEGEERVPHSHVVNSLTNALWIAQSLILALDEVLEADRTDDQIILRLPAIVAEDFLLEEKTSAASQEGLFLNQLLSGVSNRLLHLDSLNVSEVETEYLRQQLIVSLTRGLGFARSHEEVVVLGNLLELCQKEFPVDLESIDRSATSLWVAGISNLLRETASNTRDFAVVLWVTKGVLGIAYGLDFTSSLQSTFGSWLTRLLDHYVLTRNDVLHCCSLVYQAIEILQPIKIAPHSLLYLDVFSDSEFSLE